MKALVLVGGEGTRLRPLTSGIPKQMLPIVEVPMIGRVLGGLAAHGVEEVVLALGYRPEAFVDVDLRLAQDGPALTYAIEPAPLDTAGAIRFAAGSAGVRETFLVLNGDVLTDLDLTALVAFHRIHGAEATLALVEVEEPSNFGVVRTDGDGRVLAFVEKPALGSVSRALINAGVYVLEPSVLERIPPGRRVSIEREVFPVLAAEGSLFAMASDAYWIDIGTPARYLRAHLDLLEGRRPMPPAPGAVLGDRGVWALGEPVVDGQVSGPSLVGDAAFVAGEARVERSVVGSGARVHDQARVRGSVLLPGAAVRAHAVVEDSIVGERAVVAEGAELRGLTVVGGGLEVPAGMRLDGARLPQAG